MGCNICKEETQNAKENSDVPKNSKFVHGIAIIDIHQIKKERGWKEILDKKEVQKAVIQSFQRIQTEKCLEVLDEIATEKFEFTHFQIKQETFPVLAVFELKVKTRSKLFVQCGKEEKHEIFDYQKKVGEVTVITSYWQPKSFELYYTKNQLQEYFFINDSTNQDSYKKADIPRAKLSVLSKQSIQEDEKENISRANDSLEISMDYFKKFYKFIMKISQGGFGVVSLYYDSKKQKLFAVKFMKNRCEDENQAIDLSEKRNEEMKRVMQAITRTDLHPKERFNDKQDCGIEGLNRNIVREIMITYNRKKNDKINNLEGVLYCEKEKNYLLVFDFFGGCEVGQEKLTCDLFRYIEANFNTVFRPMPQKERREFVLSTIKQILIGMKHLYEQDNIYEGVDRRKASTSIYSKTFLPKILLRDLNQANILIRRKFTKTPKKSVFQILLIDFGMAKSYAHHHQCQNISNMKQGSSYPEDSTFKFQNSAENTVSINSLLNSQLKNNTIESLKNNNSKISKCNSHLNQIKNAIKNKRQTSIAIQACSPGRFPKYLFDEYQPYRIQDDIFAISALYFQLCKQLQIKLQTEDEVLIETLSGHPFDVYQKYNLIMNTYFSENCFQNARNLYVNGLQTTLEYQSKIPTFKKVLELFKIEGDSVQDSFYNNNETPQSLDIDCNRNV